MFFGLFSFACGKKNSSFLSYTLRQPLLEIPTFRMNYFVD